MEIKELFRDKTDCHGNCYEVFVIKKDGEVGINLTFHQNNISSESSCYSEPLQKLYFPSADEVDDEVDFKFLVNSRTYINSFGYDKEYKKNVMLFGWAGFGFQPDIEVQGIKICLEYLKDGIYPLQKFQDIEYDPDTYYNTALINEKIVRLSKKGQKKK